MNATLHVLDISHNNISDDGAVAIGKALSQYKDNANEVVTNKDNIQKCALQKLDISCNEISSEGTVDLSDCLKYSNTLQNLQYHGVIIDRFQLF